MVTLPFNVACRYCQNCERGLTSYCLKMNPAEGVAGAAYGYADMGPYQGVRSSTCVSPTRTSTPPSTPSFLVSHELPLDEAPDAYRHFDARDDGWTKVVLKPDGPDGHSAH
jgi:threonine dehydrogenase-like Zn-dependent dehydrogenase